MSTFLSNSDNVQALAYDTALDILAVANDSVIDFFRGSAKFLTISPSIGTITDVSMYNSNVFYASSTDSELYNLSTGVTTNIGTTGVVDSLISSVREDSNPNWPSEVYTSYQVEAASATRAGQANFPDDFLVIAEASAVTIYDMADASMWMVFNAASNNLLRYATISAIDYEEGRLFTSSASGNCHADFIGDSGRLISASANAPYNGNISQRNDALNIGSNDSAERLVNSTVNDVAATVRTLEGKSDNTNYFLIGDSLCTPNGRPAPSPDNGIVSWNWQLQNEGLYNFTVDAQNGRAIAGYTAPAYIKPEVGRVKVIIEMGSNDANGVTTETQYKESYQALMADLISRGFLRENIYNLLPPLAEDAPPTTDVLNARLAEVRTWTLDLFPDAWDIPTRPGPYSDYLHPTQDGHTGFKQRWLPFLSQASDRGGVLTTNLLSGTDVLATQSVTTVAGLYTVSFTGAGSIALTGTATGTLDSATYPQQDRQSLTFTATAGSLTLTVTGDVRLAQLEQSATLHDYVPSLVGPNSDYTNPAKQLINRDIGGGQFVTDDINMFIPDWAVATAGGVSASRDSGAVWDITGQTDAPAYIDYTADQKIMTSYQIEAEQAVYTVPDADQLFSVFARRYYPSTNAAADAGAPKVLFLANPSRGISAGASLAYRTTAGLTLIKENLIPIPVDPSPADSVQTPTNTSPANAATDVNIAAPLVGSAFAVTGAAQTHTASQWQVATDAGFTAIVFDSGTDAANLETITVSPSLDPETAYFWRVRYQGDLTGFSSYSSGTTFTTAVAVTDGDWANYDGTLDGPLFELADSTTGLMKGSFAWFDKSAGTFILTRRHDNSNIYAQVFSLDTGTNTITAAGARQSLSVSPAMDDTKGSSTAHYVEDGKVLVTWRHSNNAVACHITGTPAALAASNTISKTAAGPIAVNHYTNNDSVWITDNTAIMAYTNSNAMAAVFIDTTAADPVFGDQYNFNSGSSNMHSVSAAYQSGTGVLCIGQYYGGSTGNKRLRYNTIAIDAGGASFVGSHGQLNQNSGTGTTAKICQTLTGAGSGDGNFHSTWLFEGNVDEGGFRSVVPNADPSNAPTIGTTGSLNAINQPSFLASIPPIGSNLIFTIQSGTGTSTRRRYVTSLGGFASSVNIVDVDARATTNSGWICLFPYDSQRIIYARRVSDGTNRYVLNAMVAAPL